MAARAAMVSDFYGFPLYVGGGKTLAGSLRSLLKGRGRARRVYYMNPHVFNLSFKDQKLRRCLEDAEYLLPDGWGVVWAARRAGLPVVERLPLSDHLETLASVAAMANRSLFLWGGQAGVAEKAAQNLKSRHRGLRVAGTAHGYQGESGRKAVLAKIRKSRAAILALGLGSPAQENLCDRYSRQSGPRLYVAVGNALAFAAGTQKRAPGLVQALRMEWAWRLALQPSKMWRRYLVGNVLFIVRALSARRGDSA